MKCLGLLLRHFFIFKGEMKKVDFLNYVFLLVLGFFPQFAFAQCTPCNDPAPVGIIDYNSARISILSGGNVEFNFLNLNDYKAGKTLTNKTVLGISICDCNSTAGADPIANSGITGWDLYFDTDDTEFVGSDPANTLDLCFLEAQATIRNGLVGIITNGFQVLDQEGSPPLPLASEDVNPAIIAAKVWSTDQLNITYRFASEFNVSCLPGQAFPLINSPVVGDYYTVTVSFTLVPRCGACFDTAY